MSYVIPTIFTAVDRFTPPMLKMMKTNQSFALQSEIAVARVDRAFNKLVPSLSNVGKQFLQFASITSALLLVGRSFRTLQDFEKGLVAVGKTADISGNQLKDFGDEIIRLSNRRVGISSDKLLELSAVAGQLGVKGTGNILKFSDTLAQLELATDVVGEEGAKNIARILNITGEGVGTVDRFGAALVDLGNNSAASEMEILSMASEVGKATATFGLASTSILGISAALTSLGATPEAAGTAIGKLFYQLEQATVRGGALQRRFSQTLGISNVEMNRLFKEDKNKLFVKFAQGLEKIKNSGGSVASELNKLGLTGERTLKGLGPLANGSDAVRQSMERSVRAYEENIALQKESQQAMRTVSAVINHLKNRWDNMVNSVMNAEGRFSMLRGAIMFVADNLGLLAGVTITYIGILLITKISLLAVKGALFLYSVWTGISTAITGGLTIALARNVVVLNTLKTALIIAKVATWLWTGAMAALNAVMALNPIFLIVMGVALLVAGIAILINKWNEWGAAVTLVVGIIAAFFSPVLAVVLGLVSLFQSVRRNWDLIVTAFQEGGLIEGLKMIGKTIIDAVLMPLQQLLEVIAKVTGFDWASSAANSIAKFRSEMGVNTTTDESGRVIEPINPEANKTDALKESVRTNNANVIVDNKTGFLVTSDQDFVQVKTTPTFAF